MDMFGKKKLENTSRRAHFLLKKQVSNLIIFCALQFRFPRHYKLMRKKNPQHPYEDDYFGSQRQQGGHQTWKQKENNTQSQNHGILNPLKVAASTLYFLVEKAQCRAAT